MSFRFSRFPWRRGIGSDYRLVLDAQSSVVAREVGSDDAVLIAGAPELLEYVELQAQEGSRDAKELLIKLHL